MCCSKKFFCNTTQKQKFGSPNGDARLKLQCMIRNNLLGTLVKVCICIGQGYCVVVVFISRFLGCRYFSPTQDIHLLIHMVSLDTEKE